MFYDLDGFYSCYDGDSPSDFWMLDYDDEDGRDYLLVHFVKNKDNGRLEYVRYFGVIRKYMDQNEMIVQSVKCSRKLCESSGVEDCNENVKYFVDFSKKTTHVYPSCDDCIKTISFERAYSKGADLPLNKLYRIENADDYYKLMFNAIDATEDRFMCGITKALFAITRDFFYIILGDEDRRALKIDKKYLKVPRGFDFVRQYKF